MKVINRCTGKKKYAFKHKAINSIKKHYLKNGVKLRMYECPVCLDFHLTKRHPEPDDFYKAFLPKKNTLTKRQKKRRRQTTNRKIRMQFFIDFFSKVDYPQNMWKSIKYLF